MNTLLKIRVDTLSEVLNKFPESYITESGELAILPKFEYNGADAFTIAPRNVFGKMFLVDKGPNSTYLIIGEYTNRGLLFCSKLYVHKDICSVLNEWELREEIL